MRQDPIPIDPKLVPSSRLEKAHWESGNEGVHERVNFDDTIWGFDLAGGAPYGVPIRVTRVKFNSRAQKACVKLGDTVLKLDDVPTDTLTLQEAHDIIIKAGIHLRMVVTAPDDTETTYHCWQDLPEPDENKTIEEQKRKKRHSIICKTTATYDLKWPWVPSNNQIYHETNCGRVPSKFESKFRNKLLPPPKELEIVHPFKMCSRQYERVEEDVEEGEKII